MALDVMRNFAKDRDDFLRYEREMKRRRMNEWEDEYLYGEIEKERLAKEAALKAKDAALEMLERERQAKQELLELLERRGPARLSRGRRDGHSPERNYNGGVFL